MEEPCIEGLEAVCDETLESPPFRLPLRRLEFSITRKVTDKFKNSDNFWTNPHNENFLLKDVFIAAACFPLDTLVVLTMIEEMEDEAEYLSTLSNYLHRTSKGLIHLGADHSPIKRWTREFYERNCPTGHPWNASWLVFFVPGECLSFHEAFAMATVKRGGESLEHVLDKAWTRDFGSLFTMHDWLEMNDSAAPLPELPESFKINELVGTEGVTKEFKSSWAEFKPTQIAALLNTRECCACYVGVNDDGLVIGLDQERNRSPERIATIIQDSVIPPISSGNLRIGKVPVQPDLAVDVIYMIAPMSRVNFIPADKKVMKRRWALTDLGEFFNPSAFPLWLLLQPPLRWEDIPLEKLVLFVREEHRRLLPEPLQKLLDPETLESDFSKSLGGTQLVVGISVPFCLSGTTELDELARISAVIREHWDPHMIAKVVLLFDSRWLDRAFDLEKWEGIKALLTDCEIADVKCVLLRNIVAREPVEVRSSFFCLVKPVVTDRTVEEKHALALKLMADSKRFKDDEWWELVESGAVLFTKSRRKLVEIVSCTKHKVFPIRSYSGEGLTTLMRLLAYELGKRSMMRVIWLHRCGKERDEQQRAEDAFAALSNFPHGTRVLLLADSDVDEAVLRLHRDCSNTFGRLDVILVCGTTRPVGDAQVLDPILARTDLPAVTSLFCAGTKQHLAVSDAVNYAEYSELEIDRHFFVFCLAAREGNFKPALDRMAELYLACQEVGGKCFEQLKHLALVSACAPEYCLRLPKEYVDSDLLEKAGMWLKWYADKARPRYEVCFKMHHAFARLLLCNFILPDAGAADGAVLYLPTNPERLRELWCGLTGFLKEILAPVALKVVQPELRGLIWRTRREIDGVRSNDDEKSEHC